MEKDSFAIAPLDKSSKDLLNVPESKNLFSEAFTSDYLNWKTTGAAIVVVGTAAILGARSLSRAANSVATAGENAALKSADAAAIETLAAEAGKRAGAGSLTLEGKAIPNVARDAISENALKSEQAFQSLKTTAADRYTKDLGQISSYVPLQHELTTATKFSSIADSSLAMRAVLTKEKTGAAEIAKEIDRLTKLNPSLSILEDGMVKAGTTVKLADDAFLKKVSDDLVFKHVPPIGQFMKGTGKITEEQIGKALEIQKGMAPEAPRKLLGQILVDNKLALQADVDLAFARQTEMKAVLQKIRDGIFAK
ncbi:MAG: hypothetical protein K2X77_29315 [Candidatus Obscuribacterales bacterium]|jgi:hypothetical protein|nr:hypothetical protein [Candidatus Obscuribacterales bacterium]